MKNLNKKTIATLLAATLIGGVASAQSQNAADVAPEHERIQESINHLDPQNERDIKKEVEARHNNTANESVSDEAVNVLESKKDFPDTKSNKGAAENDEAIDNAFKQLDSRKDFPEERGNSKSQQVKEHRDAAGDEVLLPVDEKSGKYAVNIDHSDQVRALKEHIIERTGGTIEFITVAEVTDSAADKSYYVDVVYKLKNDAGKDELYHAKGKFDANGSFVDLVNEGEYLRK